MKRMKKTGISVVLALIMTLAFGLAVSGCGEDKNADLITFEAEKAIVEGLPSGGGGFAVESKGNSASGWEYISNLAVAGNSVTFVFESSIAGSANIAFTLANTISGSVMNLSDCVKITVNGAEKAISGTLSEADENCEKWETVQFSVDNIAKGNNIVKLIIKENSLGANGGAAAPNVDYMGLFDKNFTAHSHNWADSQIGGCVYDGRTHSKCDKCEYEYDHDFIGAEGHKVSDDKICTVCNETVYIYEAEYADLTKYESSYGSVIDISATASNGYSLGSFSVIDNTIKFTIESTKQNNAVFIFRFASTKWAAGSVGGSAHIDNTVLNEVVTIKLNGEDITPVAVLPGSVNEYYYNWKYVVVEHEITADTNTLEIISKVEQGAPNVDCVQMTTEDAQLSWVNIDNINNVPDVDNEFAKVHAAKPENKYANEFIVEAENSDFTSGHANSGGDNASGTGYVGDVYNNNSITFKFNSLVAGKGNIVLKMSSTAAAWNGSVCQNMIDYNLKENTTLKFNGGDVDLQGLVLAGFPTENFFNWNYLEAKDLIIKEGANELVFNISCNWGGPNMDCVYVYSDLTLDADLPQEGETTATVNKEKSENIFTNELVIEAETAKFSGGEAKTDGTDMSGDAYLGDVKDGKYVTFAFNSDVAGKGNIVFKMSSTAGKWEDGQIANMADYNLGENTTLKIGSDNIDMTGLVLFADTKVNFYFWNYLTVSDVNFEKGLNTMTFTVPCTWGGPNIDCIYVLSDTVCTVAEAGNEPNENVVSVVEKTKQGNSFANELIVEAEASAFTGDKAGVKDNGTDMSGGAYVGDVMNGNSITFTFNAAEAGKATILLKMSSTAGNWVEGQIANMVDYSLGENTTLKIGNANIGMTGLVLFADATVNFYYWNYLTLTGVDLVKGANTVTLNVPCEWAGPNIDCMFVLSDVVCSIA